MTGPELPPPDQPITVDVYLHRWPTGAEKVEFIDGALIFLGEFDDRDKAIAARTYPGREIALEPHGIEVRPAADSGGMSR